MTSRAARLARGWVVGGFATLIAALSHSVGGGDIPSPLAILVGLVFAGLLGTAVTARRPSLPRVAIVVGVSQLAFHAVFSLLGTPAADAASSAGSMAGMDHGSMTTLVVSGVTHAGHPAGAAMWFAHAVAALATLLFLARAERAFWGLLVLFARSVLAVFRGVPVVGVPRPSRVAVQPELRPVAALLLASALSRRGPPLAASL